MVVNPGTEVEHGRTDDIGSAPHRTLARLLPDALLSTSETG